MNGGTVHVSLSFEGMALLTPVGAAELAFEAMLDFPWLRPKQIVIEPAGNPFVPEQAGIGFDMPEGKSLPVYYEVRHSKIFR